MQTVRDESGTRYLLVKRSGDSSLVRNLQTGEERYLENAALTTIEGESPLEVAIRGIPTPVRRVVTAVSSERALGLLVELVDHGPLTARELLDAYDLCESDLFRVLSEFRAAGLVEPANVSGERGYVATELAMAAADSLRE